MNMRGRTYRYVGPADLKPATGSGPRGHRIGSADDFGRWVAEQPVAELAEPFTFVVDLEGFLWLAPRRSEHVACAGGEPVLGAGEIGFVREAGYWLVDDVTNHSTGYCPDPGSWPAVAWALERAGLPGPSGFTHEVVFRRCPSCGERAIVRGGDFVCVFCDGDLPRVWNVDPDG